MNRAIRSKALSFNQFSSIVRTLDARRAFGRSLGGVPPPPATASIRAMLAACGHALDERELAALLRDTTATTATSFDGGGSIAPLETVPLKTVSQVRTSQPFTQLAAVEESRPPVPTPA